MRKKLKEEYVDDDIKIELLELEVYRLENMIENKVEMISELNSEIYELESPLFLDIGDYCQDEELLRIKELIARAREIK
ncbi:hypothetical protein LQK36_004456 [Vibrio vulnificus]|nr:hypothetical protein [Vibrio vulnificus]